jgi:UDP-N-acetyl-D-glucosamine dehydrogenase
MSSPHLADHIRTCAAQITVIGQGYVGLPPAVAFAEAGFCVVGLDTNVERVVALNDGISCSPDVENEKIVRLRLAGRSQASADFSALDHSDVVIICVPMPLRKSKDPPQTSQRSVS